MLAELLLFVGVPTRQTAGAAPAAQEKVQQGSHCEELL